MNSQLVIRICILLLIAIVGIFLWQALMTASEGVKLVGFILLGSGGGLLAVKYLLPWIGDAFGGSVYSSGEQFEPDNMTKAAGCISQGDYNGAIGYYNKMLEENPADPFPVAEIAKVYAERLHDPQSALAALSNHLQSKDWPVDDAAFIMFRIVELHMTHLHDFASARDMLEQVVANFPNTRHSANAHHKISEVEQAEYKFMMDQRAKAAAASAAQQA